MTEPTVPKVSDAYWFEWSKNHIDSSLERRDAALRTLQTLVVWLWGIYTAFAAIGFTLAEKALDPVTTAVIGTASALLIAVYWACVWGQLPVSVEFDPRSPTEISEAHAAIVQEKNRRLRIAMVLSLVAASSVAMALAVAGGARTAAPSPNLQVAGGPVSSDADPNASLAVTARIAANTLATVDVILDPGTNGARSEAPRSFLSTKEGLLQISVPVAMAKTYRVSVTWPDGIVMYRMSYDLDLSDSGPP